MKHPRDGAPSGAEKSKAAALKAGTQKAGAMGVRPPKGVTPLPGSSGGLGKYASTRKPGIRTGAPIGASDAIKRPGVGDGALVAKMPGKGANPWAGKNSVRGIGSGQKAKVRDGEARARR